jgi:hypothetical protein
MEIARQWLGIANDTCSLYHMAGAAEVCVPAIHSLPRTQNGAGSRDNYGHHEGAQPPRSRQAHLDSQQYFVEQATAWYVRLSIARIRATGVTDLCRPDRKIIAEASLRDGRIDIPDAAARPFADQGFGRHVVRQGKRRNRFSQGRDLLLLPQQAGPVPRNSPRRDGVSSARNTSSRARARGRYLSVSAGRR